MHMRSGRNLPGEHFYTEVTPFLGATSSLEADTLLSPSDTGLVSLLWTLCNVYHLYFEMTLLYHVEIYIGVIAEGMILHTSLLCRFCL